ncbi:MAG: BrnA antitoxin family protein [Sedimenticola sp.]
MKKLKAVPEFVGEEEERRFWEHNNSSDYLDWGKAQQVVMPNLKPTIKTISLRLPQHFLNSIKAAAHSRDVPYQSLIKVWLQEKLHSH